MFILFLLWNHIVKNHGMNSIWPTFKVVKRKRTPTFKGVLFKVQRPPKKEFDAISKKNDIDTCPALFREYIGDIWDDILFFKPSQGASIERRIDQLMFDIETTCDISENASSIEECCEST
jgi:hypothetical protein